MAIPHSAVSIFAAGLVVLAAGAASGQDYPSKPIRIVTAAAGGGSDFTARQLAQGMQGPLGQPVIIENRGSGLIQYEYLSRAAPDGYSLLISGGAFWIAPLLQKIPYDVLRDFVPISVISREVNVIVVHPSLPVKSVRDLIALAKARPGELNYGSGVNGGPNHLGMELFKSMAGVNIVRVTYKGTAPVITALVGGEVQVTAADPGLVTPHAKVGRLKALAVTSMDQSALAPGLPSVSESGLPGYELLGATGFFAPGKTPAAIINRLSQEVARVVRQPEVKERFFNAQAEVVGSTPEEITARIKSDVAKWGKVVREAGIPVE